MLLTLFSLFIMHISIIYVLTIKYNKTMSSLRVFTEEDRDQIINSNVNNSTSKFSYSFSREKRFNHSKTQCPQVCYNITLSTISNNKKSFTRSQRRVFTEVTDAPSSWKYNPKLTQRKSIISFAKGRSQVIANSYVEPDPLNNPGPDKYSKSLFQRQKSGYTMRPKTANNRNYFIQDKEQELVPGPGAYQTLDKIKIVGINVNSKYKTPKTNTFNKCERFFHLKNNVPGSSTYMNDSNYKWKKGSKIGCQTRTTFTDKKSVTKQVPGPGSYKLPSEFGHYKKFRL